MSTTTTTKIDKATDWTAPWEGEGFQSISDTGYSADDLFLAFPEFAAEVHPQEIQTPSGFVIPDRVANFRDAHARLWDDGVGQIPAKYVGTVSTTYRVIQDPLAFKFVDDVKVASEDQATIVAATHLREGRWTAVTTHLGDDYLIPGDPQEQRGRYLAFINSTDASLSFSVVRTNIKIVCRNTLNAAVRTGRVYRVRHTTNALERVHEARAMLGLMQVAADREAKIAERMADVKIPDAAFDAFLESLFPTKDKSGKQREEGRGLTMAQNRQSAVKAIYLNHPTIGDKRGTAWGAFNAVTAWDEHVRNQKPDVRFASAVVTGNRASEDAFDWLVKFDKSGKTEKALTGR
jgi:phage/plasmid-like protein (TIGR03299 family)